MVPGLGLIAGGRSLDAAYATLERRYREGAAQAAAAGLLEEWRHQGRQAASNAGKGSFGRFLSRAVVVAVLIGVALLPAGWVMSGAVERLSTEMAGLKDQAVWESLDESLARSVRSLAEMPEAQRLRLLTNLRQLSRQLAPFVTATDPLWGPDSPEKRRLEQWLKAQEQAEASTESEDDTGSAPASVPGSGTRGGWQNPAPEVVPVQPAEDPAEDNAETEAPSAAPETDSTPALAPVPGTVSGDPAREEAPSAEASPTSVEAQSPAATAADQPAAAPATTSAPSSSAESAPPAPSESSDTEAAPEAAATGTAGEAAGADDDGN